jgi:hypothetical protein
MKKKRLSSSGSRENKKGDSSGRLEKKEKPLSGGSLKSAKMQSQKVDGSRKRSPETIARMRAAAERRLEQGTWMVDVKFWTPAEDALLGTSSDAELGDLLGRSRSSVVGRRRKLGIKAYRSPGRAPGESIPWAEHKKGKRKK